MGKLFSQWFVSRKENDALLRKYNERGDKILQLEQQLSGQMLEIEKLKAVNTELIKFSESFKEFYQKVTHLPVLVRQERGVKSIACSLSLRDREMSYGHVVDSMKQQLAHDLAENLLRSGSIHFDLVDDPITGGTVYKASISVVGGGNT